MSFVNPTNLWLLALVPVLAAGYLVLQRRRRHYAARFTNLDLLDSVAPRRPGWRRHVTAALAALAVALLAVAMAQPVMAVTVRGETAVVVLAIDVSSSMAATDVEPDRMTAAVQAAQTFLDDLPDGYQVGLVAFDRSARVVTIPTDDHQAVADALAALQTANGTAAGDAVAASVTLVSDTLAAQGLEVADDDAAAVAADDAGTVPAAIVLLSDGETTSGITIDQAAALASAAGVPVSTITFGTDQGQVAVRGQTVAVPPDGAAMQALADATGGTAFTATSEPELGAIYDDISSRIGTTTEDREVTLAVVGLGMGGLLAALGSGLAWSGRFL